MILVTTDFISGKELETIAMVKGSTVQCKNVGKDIMSGFKNLVGGEMRSYTEMMDEARAIATRASSFIRASQAGSSHHMVRMKPVFSGSPAMERISSQVAAV